MHHPDLRHHARDRIVAAEVMKLDLHEAELHATRGEPGVIDTETSASGPRFNEARPRMHIASITYPEAGTARAHGGKKG